MATKVYGEFPVLDSNNKWTGEWRWAAIDQTPTPTLRSLREPAHYWVISDAQLKRDLRGRTIEDVYRENRAKRGPEPRLVARCAAPGTRDWDALLDDYDRFMRELRGPKWRPHPASVDPEHPLNKHRERAPRRETVA